MYGYPYNQMTNYGNYGLNPQIPSPTRSEIIRVHGEEGAKAYQLPPNSAVLLLDDTNPILWFKSTDGAGYPQVTAYDISPHVETREIVPQQSYDYQALEERISKLERRLNNGKSYSGNVRQAQSSENKQQSVTAAGSELR